MFLCFTHICAVPIVQIAQTCVLNTNITRFCVDMTSKRVYNKDTKGGDIVETKDILKQLREKHGYSIKDVSTGTKMQYTMCREYESGDRKLGMSAAIKFADFYHVSIDYLLGRHEADDSTDPILQLSDKFHLSKDQAALLVAYLNMNESDRENLIRCIKVLARGIQ